MAFSRIFFTVMRCIVFSVGRITILRLASILQPLSHKIVKRNYGRILVLFCSIMNSYKTSLLAVLKFFRCFFNVGLGGPLLFLNVHVNVGLQLVDSGTLPL